ncbi:glycoside hydrolase family 172 protein [Arenibacter sp. S6351L]|uniref:glycoside hydrolase family 172 protein n=1 Tax=Arenibacter sp. S6351L TaxID=2926407 RepID=UPI001FF3069B|nr:glycoside hydrolase family 172 protein [Arenibacter sp. S6351L]MCK0136024.1 DUF2961 domain-containing protein [Arenibacter sp. S6351L]
MKIIIVVPFLLLIGSVTGQEIVSNADVTIATLLEEMVNKDELAKLPKHSFKTLQASSYSRKSVSQNENGWFDNADASQFVRVEVNEGRKEHVLMDVEGPGAIVRFWSTWHAQKFSMGTLRIYFDNASSPQIEGRIDEIISSNKYVGSSLSHKVASFQENGGWFEGHNLYFPLPYAKHCKITYQKADESVDDVLYYQINYRQYAPEVSVQSYQKGDWENGEFQRNIRVASKKLAQHKLGSNKGMKAFFNGVVKAGDSISTQIQGNRAIRKIALKINATHMEQALRSTVIAMEFDGKKTVWAPTGDFFGTGYKLSPHRTRMIELDKDGEMQLFFPMPFQNTAKITIHNFGNEDVELKKMELIHAPWEWDARSLYFHANWRNYPNISTSEKKDINYIEIKGKGKYVGDVLTLFNNSYEWWGEGDEKIYVDGESFPSNFGTGTEDYYGYAWCSVVDFETPFIAQPIGDGNRSPGLTVNSRWRSLDVIPFNKSLNFDMEIWHWAATQMDYAPTTFWYGTKDSEANYTEAIETVQLPLKFSNRFEAEGFDIDKIKGGEIITQAFLSYDWSARNHLLWDKLKKNDALKLTFYSEMERKGRLTMVFTHAPDYVIVDVMLNGELIFENLDLFNEKLGLKKYLLEKGKIKKGNNTLKLMVKGTNKANPKADKLGVDYLIVE